MKSPKVDNSGQQAAAEATARAQEAANSLKQNFATDLSNENLTSVIAGGSAASSDTAQGTGPRKRKAGTGLASALGVNV